MRYIHSAAVLLAVATALAARAESKTSISGKVYADLTYRENADNGRHIAAGDTGTEFDLKRFYFTVDHSFDDVWGARFRTDVGDVTPGKHIEVFVKNAYIEARIAPELILRAGAADLPWVPFVEDLYGFRYVENVLIDRTKFGTSADWGLHAVGKFGGGIVNYAVSVVNGRGYSDFTRSQAPTVEGRIGLVPVNGLTLAVGGQVGKLGQNLVGVAAPNNAQRLDAVAAWVGGGLRVGLGGFYAKDYSADIIHGTKKEDEALGGSGWLSFEFAPHVSVFGRTDYVQPDREAASNLRDLYVNAGLQVQPVAPVDLALVFKHDRVEHGALSTSNGTIGSTVASADGTFNEVGLFAQYVF